MKVLVTRGAGNIGAMVVAKLLERGDEITILDDLRFGGVSELPFLGYQNNNFIRAVIVSGNSALD